MNEPRHTADPDRPFEGPAADVARGLRARPADLVAAAAPTPRCLDPEALVALACGELTGDARETALDHTGACPRCLLALDAALDAAGDELALAERAGKRGLRLVPILAAAAAALLLALLVRWVGAPGPDEGLDGSARVAELARIEPLELRLTRGAPRGSAFDRAQAAYLDGELARAAEILAAEEELDASSALLLGSALLLQGRPEEALVCLLPRAGIDAAIAREAGWLACQARLLRGEADAARLGLAALAGSEGARASDARELLDELRRLGTAD